MSAIVWNIITFVLIWFFVAMLFSLAWYRFRRSTPTDDENEFMVRAAIQAKEDARWLKFARMQAAGTQGADGTVSRGLTKPSKRPDSRGTLGVWLALLAVVIGGCTDNSAGDTQSAGTETPAEPGEMAMAVEGQPDSTWADPGDSVWTTPAIPDLVTIGLFGSLLDHHDGAGWRTDTPTGPIFSFTDTLMHKIWMIIPDTIILPDSVAVGEVTAIILIPHEQTGP